MGSATEEQSGSLAGVAEEIGAMVMTASKIPVVFPNTHPNYVGQFQDDPAIMPDIDAFWSLGAPMFKTGARPGKPLVSRSATIMHTSLVLSERLMMQQKPRRITCRLTPQGSCPNWISVWLRTHTLSAKS